MTPLDEPSFTKTYRQADGEQIADHDWVTTMEYFDVAYVPVELVEETWERTAVRTFWLMPTNLYDCEVGGPGEVGCGNAAIGWQRSGGDWAQVCAIHDDGSAVRP